MSQNDSPKEDWLEVRVLWLEVWLWRRREMRRLAMRRIAIAVLLVKRFLALVSFDLARTALVSIEAQG